MKKNILIVDDDRAILEVLQIILEEQNYIPNILSDGEKVFHTAATNDIKLILLDYWMAGMDGGKVTRQLKENEKTRNIPVIIVSANHQIKDVVKACGADGFLPKPFEISDLIDKVNQFAL